MSLLMIVLSLVACRPEGLKPTNCRDGKCTYTFAANKAIEITVDSTIESSFVEIVSGAKRVFHYQYTANDQAMIADDEYTENIYFEIDPSLDSFSYTDSKIADANLIVQPVCFCVPVIYQPIIGSLSGERKSDGHWEITVDVEYESYGAMQSISFTARFEEE